MVEVLRAAPGDRVTVGLLGGAVGDGEVLEAGLHVLVEKPISSHKADAERLIAAHTDTLARVLLSHLEAR